jgi:uncharacterized protein DUF6644
LSPHPVAGPAWQVWLETSAVAVAMRQWTWLYPAVEIGHILGFVLVVGAAVMFDLRLLGLSRRLPVSVLAWHLLPWSWAGLLLVIPSGLLMFTAHATEMAANPAFRLKLTLLACAGVNALLFERRTFQSVAGWDQEVTVPLTARAAAVASLLLWAGVISCGRLLAYL